MSGGYLAGNSPLEAALEIARRGLSVFPLHSVLSLPSGALVCSCGTARCQNPGKHPLARLAPRGLKNATADAATIRQWWSLVPDANIGVATGPVIVLDIDPRHSGDESFAALERLHGPFPPTWRALTGGGGEHIYLAGTSTEIRNSTGRLGPGVDVRGAGGYVVAPPSQHISGLSYEWSVGHHPDLLPLATVPEWLLQAISSPPPSERTASPSAWRRLVGEGVQEGGRNDAIARLTGHLLRRYVDPEVSHQLVQSWNALFCKPPLTEEEVTRTVNSIARKELKRREGGRGQH